MVCLMCVYGVCVCVCVYGVFDVCVCVCVCVHGVFDVCVCVCVFDVCSWCV